MNLMRSFCILAVTSATVSAAYGKAPSLQKAIGNPDNFRLSASSRVRYEVVSGQPRAGLRPKDEQLAVRNTVFAEYRTKDLRIGAELYDSRVYLDKPGSAVGANEVNTFELVQAYIGADLKDALGAKTSTQLQLGRMTLNLGSRRLVAADDYRNTTNGYTGLRADLKTKTGTTATLIYVLPQVRLPDDLPSIHAEKTRWDRESFDLRLWGGVVAQPKAIAGAIVEASYFGLKELDSPGRPTRNRNLTTFSARIICEPKARQLDFEAEGIYQLGHIRSGLATSAPTLGVGAWFAHVDVGYMFPGSANLRLSGEYDYASGDGPGAKFGRFDTLFGMRRADLAPAGIYNAIGRANINTPGVRLEVAPSKRFDAFAVYRAIWLANRTDAFSTTGVRDPSGKSGDFAGHQVEGRARYWLVPNFLRAEVNAAWLKKGRFLKTAPNAPRTGDTAYLATGITAMF